MRNVCERTGSIGYTYFVAWLRGNAVLHPGTAGVDIPGDHYLQVGEKCTAMVYGVSDDGDWSEVLHFEKSERRKVAGCIRLIALYVGHEDGPEFEVRMAVEFNADREG